MKHKLVSTLVISTTGKARMTKKEMGLSQYIGTWLPIEDAELLERVALSEEDDKARAHGLTIAYH